MVMKIDYGNKARYSKFSFLISDSKLCKYVGCVVGAFSPLVRPRTWTIVYQESEAEPFFSSRTLVTADSKLLTPTRAVISIKCGELYDCWLAITCSCQQIKHYSAASTYSTTSAKLDSNLQIFAGTHYGGVVRPRGGGTKLICRGLWWRAARG